MSKTFSSFANIVDDSVSNSGQFSQSDKSGYFRIGLVTLQIPPEDIITQRSVNNDRIPVLRSMNEMFTKSGQTRWDVIVRWKVLLTDDPSNPDVYFQQWDDLQTIIAQFKAAPFIETESPHLRQIFAQNSPGMAQMKLAMAQRQLRIDTDPDIVDCLNVTLNMTFFNYLPYSVHFGYKGDDGVTPVNAYSSSEFINYIQSWKTKNLSCKASQPGDPEPPAWKTQVPGTTKFSWREYTQVNSSNGLNTFQGKTLTPPANKPYTGRSASGKLKANVDKYNDLFIKYAAVYGIDPALVKAFAMDESGCTPNVVNANGKKSEDAIAMQAINTAPDGGVAFCDGRKHTAIGMMQLDWTTARSLRAGVTPKQLLDAETSIDLGCRFIHQRGITLQTAWRYQGAYMSQAKVDAVKSKTGATLLTSEAYQANIQAYYDQASLGQTNTPLASSHTTNTAVLPNSGSTALAASHTQNASVAATTDANFDVERTNMADQGWTLDHRVDGAAFYYKQHVIELASPDSNDYLTNNTHDYGLFPAQISVMFVNNLAQIPLAGYQYPTYQHVGPSSSVVSISMTSVGQELGDDLECLHADLANLTTMSHTLEEQYNKLRSTFRLTSSIYRTQAVFVQNQILNLCGIHGLMLDQITTETIRESANMLAVQMTAGQYENVFEDIGPWRTNGIGQQYMKTFSDILLGNPSGLDTLSQEEKDVIPNIVAYRMGYLASDENYIVSKIYDASKGIDVLNSLNDMDKVTLTPGELTDISEYIKDNYSDNPGLLDRAKNLQAGTQPTAADFIVLFSVVQAGGSTPESVTSDPIASSYVDATSEKSAVLAYLVAAKTRINAQIASKRQGYVKQMYEMSVQPLFSGNAFLARETAKLISSPKFSKLFSDAVPAGGPSSSNLNHGAYRGMGLDPISSDGKDSNPSMYFVNDKNIYIKEVKSQLEKTLFDQETELNSAKPGSNTTKGVMVSATSKPIPGDINSVMKQTEVAGYSMSEAFPAFKLFFMEENNLSVFYSFDNFFSYASLQDIEIIRPYNKPATMIIQMTNLAHMLNCKLFDDTTLGNKEKDYAKYTSPVIMSPDGTVTAQGGGGYTLGVSGGKNLSGQPYVDYRSGRPDMKDSTRKIPMNMFPLQTGTKIQLRIGSTNDPDQLYPVFSGVITEIEGEDTITITAQSFLAELVTAPVDSLNHNSWWHLGAALSITDKGAGPAYGGVTLFGKPGDVGSVMSSFLQASNAKHFGHWQTGVVPNQMLKGYSWFNLPDIGADGAAGLGLPRVSALFRSTYDRTEENIMVSQYTAFDGSSLAANSRSYFDQQGDSFLSTLRPAAYYIQENCPFTLLELMQDVARRYPEYLLLEKPYGFPYASDATLAFGHPFDWYYARYQLIGDAETERAAASNPTKYKEWWESIGQKMLHHVLAEIASRVNIIDRAVGGHWVSEWSWVDQAGDSPENLDLVLKRVSSYWNNGSTEPVEDMNWVKKVGGSISKTVNEKLFHDSFYKQANALLDSVKKSWTYVSKSATTTDGLGAISTAPSDRLQPLRKYHFIDHQSIIHNGMTINGKIYNAIKICNEPPFLANGSIPEHHRRILDVTSRLNDPDRNVMRPGLKTQVAQSFLREEIGKMYRGEIILRGTPTINPMDVLLITDVSTGIIGPVEVEQVIHSFNLENGYITIVKPRACATVNEAASPAFFAKLQRAASIAIPTVQGFAKQHIALCFGVDAAVLAGSTAVVATSVTVQTAVGGAMVAAGEALGTLGVAAATAAGTSAAAAAVPGAVIGLTGVGMVVTAPVLAPIVAVLSLCAIGFGIGVLWFADKNAKLNPLVLSPVMRFGRPWVGGLEGWKISDLLGVLDREVTYYWDMELAPSIDLWDQATGWRGNIVIQNK